jgi:ADP-heptose:LPS heptosyltransferase
VYRIAVLRPNHPLGNTLLLTPLICELEAMFPGAEIEIVSAGRAARAVFAEFGQVSAVHAFPARSYRHPGEVLRLLMALKRRSFDLAIDPDVRSRAARFLLGPIQSRDRVGFRWGEPRRDRILTHSTDASAAPSHCAQAPVYLMRSAYGLRPHHESASPLVMPTLTLHRTDAERRGAAEYLAAVLNDSDVAARPCLGIYADATGAKCYPVAWWRRIIAALSQQEPGTQVVEFVPHDGSPRLAGEIPVLFTTDLRRLGATLAATSLVVSADCGIMHLASAAGARVLGLFKTTEPARYAPYGAESEGIMASDANPDAVVTRIRAMLAAPSCRSSRKA